MYPWLHLGPITVSTYSLLFLCAFIVGGIITYYEAKRQHRATEAILRVALGALAGAALGSAAGHVGTGAAVGAGTGLVAGSAVGSGNAAAAGGSLQARYDTVYAQCMTAKGNRIAGPPVVEPVYVYPRPYYWGGH